MIHRFIDNSNTQRSLIIDVLNKYCVPYKTIINESDYYNTYYDIEIDVNDKAWEFISQKVNERLQLEHNFDMRNVSKEQIMKKDKARLLLPDSQYKKEEIVEEHVETEAEKTQKLIQEVREKRKQKKDGLSRITKEDCMKAIGVDDSLLDFVHEVLGELPNKEMTVDEFKKYCSDTGLDNKIKDKIKEKFDASEIVHGLMALTLMAGMKPTGKEFVFDELPEKIKSELKVRFPEKVLRSDKCKIIEVDGGPMGKGLSVLIEGEEQ